MMSDDICTCCTCGYQWQRGRDGSHSCTEKLRTELASAQEKISELDRECKRLSDHNLSISNSLTLEWDKTKAELAAANAENERLKGRVAALEKLRPIWNQGFTSENVAAQVNEAALAGVWSILNVENQTACEAKLRKLLAEREEREPVCFIPENELSLLMENGAWALHATREISGSINFPLYARPVPAVPEWKPIETAPKDGTHILLYYPERYCCIGGAWLEATDGDWESGLRRWMEWQVDDELYVGDEGYEPTHWMPLPAAPKEPT